MTRICPKCKQSYMTNALHYYHPFYFGWRCPVCGFNIMQGEEESLIQARVEAREQIAVDSL